MTDLGKQLALLGMESTLAAEVAVSRDFRAEAEHNLLQHVEARTAFTAEDIRPEGIEPHHPNVLGALINAAARRGLIRAVGWRAATRPSRHAAVLRVWIAN